jgi:PAS domain S-box-containing protein
MNDIVLESISDGVFTIDLDWKITSFNRAAEEITGVKRSKAIGSYCHEVFKSNMCENECPLRKTLRTRKPIINKSGYIIDLNGRRLPISVSTAILQDQNGKIIGGAETFRDLSELEILKSELHTKFGINEMFSNSPAMARIFDNLPTIADCTSTLLIEGETGTGKELIARTIHSLSSRSKGPFIAINCGALPDSLLESELFGYKKGAFTGAEKDKPGRFALAQNGTLLLDEIAEISPAMQSKLLRVLQEKEYEPLGSIKSEKTNARILAATNQTLRQLVKKGDFRQDLFYRINVLSIELPPLRDRKEDIPAIAERLLQRHKTLLNKSVLGFTEQVYSCFYSYDWPGNIRELENVIERAIVLCKGSFIAPENLPENLFKTRKPANERSSISDVVKETEKACIINTLQKNNYNRSTTSKDLGIDKATLYRKIKKYRIKLPDKDGRSSTP